MKRRQSKRRFLQALLLLICLASAGLLVQELYLAPRKNREMTKQLKEEYPKEESQKEVPLRALSPEGNPKPAGEENSPASVDLSAMQAQYPDIQGWLTVPGTTIDYPVLRSGNTDPEYYLKRNYRGEWDANGSLFLQWNCEAPDSQNLIIYGHNMNSGAMFGNLERFAATDYWREHKTIFFQTIQGTYEYEIISVMKTDVSVFPYQQAEFASEDSLLAYVGQAKILGLFETGVSCNGTKQALTLVTCSYEWEDARNLVVAVRKQEVPIV